MIPSLSPSRAAWVLVGGRSSRMGRDKALADSAGRALALRVADKAARVCPVVSVVGDPSVYSSLGLPVVADRFPGEGPLAGIETALSNTRQELNLIVACDIPSIDEDFIEQLFCAGADCAVPIHPDGKIEPLCSVYTSRCHGTILRALESGVRRVIDGIQLLKTEGFAIRYIQVPDSAAFANLNTPEDWRRYHNG